MEITANEDFLFFGKVTINKKELVSAVPESIYTYDLDTKESKQLKPDSIILKTTQGEFTQMYATAEERDADLEKIQELLK